MTVRHIDDHAATPGGTPLLMDCDPGVDDALALALALASPEIDVRAVTTVAGNVGLDQATRNALAVLELLGRGDVPVAAGARRALVRLPQPHPPVHGANGLGGAEIPEAPRAARPEHAVELMAAVLGAAPPRSVTIAALGPLTNVALLLALHPELAGRIGRIMVMGGAAGAGNVSPVAEFNVWADPEAAQRVLAEPDVDVWLVTLDVTRRATLDDTAVGALATRSRAGAGLAEMVRGYGDLAEDGWRLHDALVVAAIIDPEVIATRPALVDVETGTGLSRAQTVCAFDMPIEGWGGHGFPVVEPAIPERLRVAVDLDAERFRRLLLGRLAASAEAA